MAGKSGEVHAWFCFMITSVVRCLSMMLECTLRGGTIDGIPPTKAALVQHIMHVTVYQAGHSWVQVIIASPELLPSPSEWDLEQEH